jgi:hypothetical protein
MEEKPDPGMKEEIRCRTGGELEMPNDTILTYGQLHQKLRDLGFEEYSVEWNGKRGLAFEHPKVPASRIILPERAPDNPVEPFYMNSVLLTLKARGFFPETNPLLT